MNHDTEVAFLAVTGPRENEVVVGSACYFLNPTTNLAEVAFMVAPDWQGVGLGSALQARLQDYAISRGVRGFVAEILPRNTRMLRLATHALGHGDDVARRGRGARHHHVRRPHRGKRRLAGLGSTIVCDRGHKQRALGRPLRRAFDCHVVVVI